MSVKSDRSFGWVGVHKVRYALFVTLVFALAVFVYFGVKAAVENDIQSRLEVETLKLETVITARLEAFMTNLYGARAMFDAVEHLSPEAFRQFIEKSEIVNRFPGLRAVGVGEIFLQSQKLLALQKIRRLNPQATLQSHFRSGPIFSAITLLEPSDPVTRKVLGLDVLFDPDRAEIIQRSINSGQPVLTGAMRQLIVDGPGDRMMHIYLPMTKPHEGLLRAGDRWLSASFKVQDFFQGAFGAPSLLSERVNWKISTPRGIVYDRFSAPPSKIDLSRETTRNISILGRDFTLSVVPLANFVAPAARRLPLLAALLAVGLGVLSLFAWDAIRRRKKVETETNESLERSQNLFTQQASHLELLNKFSRSVAEEMNEESLLGHLLATIRLARIDFAYLYSADTSNLANLKLNSWAGLDGGSGIPTEISRSFMKQVMANRYAVTKEQQIMGPGLGRLLGPCSRAEDWIVANIPTRQRTDQFLLVAGNYATPFTKLQKELLDNVISHSGLGIDKINLIDRAQTSNRSKSAFLANMSHEIRTPLNALMGFSEMLAGRELSDSRRRTIASAIRKNSEYLTTIIDDVLDLSKIEAGKLKIHHRRIRLANFLAEVKAVVDLKAQEKDLNFDIFGSGPLPIQVFVDDVRLKQILLNVVGNAVKFTISGSVSMAVSCRRRRENSGEMVFYVEDTGVGMTEEAQTQLFKPFSQGDDSTTRRFGGSGLGLALSARLATELGGSLKLVRSIKDVGSVFEIVIPTGDLDGAEWMDSLKLASTLLLDDVTPKTAKVLDRCRVLLVEDSVDNQEIFTYFLSNAGAEVKVVENGAAAVTMGLNGTYDIILMDIQLPGIDGKEATRRLRSMGCMSTIVALTAHAMREERESCLQAGCDGQITKPIGEREFIDLVASYISSGRQIGESRVVEVQV